MSIHHQLRNVAKYNPQFWDDDEIRQYYIARQPLLDHLLKEISKQPNDKPAQHQLLVGQRGSGKSTLLRRLAVGITDDPILNSTWIPLSFPEEQYNITGLNKLWLNCLDALGDYLEKHGQQQAAMELDETIASLSHANADELLKALIEQAEKHQRKLLLLIDNIDLVLSRIGDEAWALRELLQSKAPLMVVGASAAAMESTFHYEAPFYEFFRIHTLRGLSLDETRDVLRLLAEVTDEPEVIKILDSDTARLATMHQLSGGNPRTVVLLFNVLRSQSNGDVLSDLKGLLDDVTPLYKARFEELPEQTQQVLDQLAIHWHPMLAGDLARQLGIKVNTVSSQLVRLTEQGLVEKVASDGKRQAFQVAERFFNVWYLMRSSRRMRQKLLWLVQFLRAFHTPEQLREHGRLLLQGQNKQQPEYLLAVAQCMQDDNTTLSMRNAIEHEAISLIKSDKSLNAKIHEILDLEGHDKHLTTALNRIEIRDEVLNIGLPTESRHLEKELQQALLSSYAMTGANKQQVANFSSMMTAEKISEIIEHIKEADAKLRLIYRHDFSPLIAAIEQGLCSSIEDLEGMHNAATRKQFAWLESFACYVEFGNSCLNGDNLNKQKYLLQKAIKADPSYSLPWPALGNILADQGNREEAEKAYLEAIKIDSTYAFAWNSLGNLLAEDSERFFDAETAFRKACYLEPDYVLWWVVLGTFLNTKPEHDEEAETVLQHAVELDPENAEARNSLAWCLFLRQHKIDEAIKHAKAACELVDTNDITLKALHSLACLKITAGESGLQETAELLRQSESEFLPYSLNDLVQLLGMHLAENQLTEVDKLFLESSKSETILPLREAVSSIVSKNENYLNMIAPEVRGSAETLAQQIRQQAEWWNELKRTRTNKS